MVTNPQGIGRLLSAIDVWQHDPSPENEQTILDVRTALTPPTPETVTVGAVERDISTELCEAANLLDQSGDFDLRDACREAASRLTTPAPKISEEHVSALALTLAAAHDAQSGSPTKAVTAIRAGVDMCRDYWENIARASLASEATQGVESAVSTKPVAGSETADHLSQIPEGLDPELVQRVQHVSDAVGKERHLRAASLTGYDWRRIAQAMSEPSPQPPIPEGMVLVPREQIRDWYTQAFAMFFALTPEEDDAEDDRPTPGLMLEMEAMLSTPAAPGTDEGAS